jgi:putative hydrolase of the HAD superfamily
MAESGNGLRPALEAVLFDAGGTLVRLDFEWIASLLAGLGVETTPAALRRAEVRGRRMYDQVATGRREITPGEPHPLLGSAAPTNVYWSGMLEGVGCRHPLLEEAIAAMWARQTSEHFLWARENEGAREAIAAVRALGLRAACLSNSDGRAEAHLVHTGTREGLEFVVDSQREGVEKPDPAIFRIALERMGVAAGRALYVGDIRSVDEVGSRAAGMHFVLLDPFGDYAGEATPSIASIGELAGFVSATFATPRTEARIPK